MGAAKRMEKELSVRYEDWEGKVQFEGLSERLERMVDELFWPLPKIEEEVSKCLRATFTEDYSEMLVEGPILVWAFCPHHLLPCRFKVYIGYIPNGKVLGLSKFSRVAVVMGKRPIMQEQYSRELADTIWEGLGPEGLGIYVVGTHGCMLVRGVMQKDTSVSTSILKGSFLEDSIVRQEFYSVCRR